MRTTRRHAAPQRPLGFGEFIFWITLLAIGVGAWLVEFGKYFAGIAGVL